jgi:hypothetical protein
MRVIENNFVLFIFHILSSTKNRSSNGIDMLHNFLLLTLCLLAIDTNVKVILEVVKE